MKWTDVVQLLIFRGATTRRVLMIVKIQLIVEILKLFEKLFKMLRNPWFLRNKTNRNYLKNKIKTVQKKHPKYSDLHVNINFDLLYQNVVKDWLRCRCKTLAKAKRDWKTVRMKIIIYISAGCSDCVCVYMRHLSFSPFRQRSPFLLRVKNSAHTDRLAYTVIECGSLVFACVTQSFEQYRLTRCFATIAYSQRTIQCIPWLAYNALL